MPSIFDIIGNYLFLLDLIIYKDLSLYTDRSQTMIVGFSYSSSSFFILSSSLCAFK